MRILTGSEIFTKNFAGSVITIGNFDGVHRGHVALLRHLKQQSVRFGLPSVVVTFEPHPLALLAPDITPPLITTFKQKAALIADEDIDCLAVIDFTQSFSMISAESFVRDVLCTSLGIRHIIIGHDYAFGRDRKGNFETLARMANECSFTLEDLDPVGEGDFVFSSSLVRRMVADGDVAGAAQILGRYHVVSGQVAHGREIGRKLGFPTANIITRNELIPPDGVYAVMVAIGDELHQGACNIGSNPTFNGKERTIEVFLLDFSGQLYDQELALCFVERLRGEKKFSHVDSLIQAINQDVLSCKNILSAADRSMVKPLFTAEHAGAKA
ncbi:MAG: bifunctional riboflavin kinase/FAD synthetase [Desulfuromonadales bacterium]|nr:bifunctional riboflavin kinase/FAD synthetase [Desulfuromonadales bacterium]